MALTKIPGNLLDKSAHIDFADNEQLRFGADNDLLIYHDTNNSIIKDGGTGHVQVLSGTFTVGNAALSKTSAVFNSGSSQDLYYNNTKVFETADGGAAVTGNLSVSGNLTVSGTTTEISTTNLQVEDKNIVLNYGSGDTSSSAGGAGITIQDAVDASNDATILWDASNDEFDFSHNITIASAGDGLKVSRSGYDTYSLTQSTGVGMAIHNVTDDRNEMHFVGDGTIAIGTTGTSGYGHLTVNSSGTQLALRASSGASQLGFFEAGAGRSYLKTLNGSDGLSLIDGDGSTVRAVINENGHMGLGTASPYNADWGSSSKQLTVQGTNYAVLNLFASSVPTRWSIGSGDDKLYFYDDKDTQHRMVIDHNGKVGIGNTSPSNNHANANMLVVGAGGAGGMALYNGANAGGYYFSRALANNSDAYDGGMSYNADRDLTFHTNAGTARMTIDGSGNVGIGDTNPQHPFKVNLSNGQVAMFGSNGQNNTGQYCGIGLGQVLANNTSYQKVSLVYEGRSNGNYIGNFRILVDTAGDSGSAGLADSKLLIDGQNGYLGVGGSNNLVPYSRAEFHLDQVAASTDVNGGSTVHFGSQQHTNGAMMGITLGYREASLNYRKVGMFAIGRGDNAARQDFAICVDTANDAGGVRDSDRKIHINGTTGVTTIGGTGVEAETYLLVVETQHGYGRQGSANSSYFHHETDRAYNYWNEAGYFNGGAHTYSDESLKKDVVVISSALDSVAKMNGVTFKWKDPSTRGGKATGEGKQFGVIAQNMLEVDPELPTLSVDPLAAGGSEEDGKLYSMDYSRITPYLIEAVKELKTKLEAAEARIATLEG